jgi:formyl-CoA transferase
MSGEVPEPQGNHHPTLVPMGCYASADGYVNIAGPSGRLLRAFCEAIGVPELPGDPRFDSSANRAYNRAELDEIIGERLRAHTTEHWVTVLNAVGVPCGPVYRVDETFADPQVEHLGLTNEVTHPELGEITLVRNAVDMTGVDRAVRTATPDPGQHTAEILGELGFDEVAIAELRRAGAIPEEHR